MFCGHSYHRYLVFSIMFMSSVSESCMFYAEFHIHNKDTLHLTSTIKYIKSQVTLKAFVPLVLFGCLHSRFNSEPAVHLEALVILLLFSLIEFMSAEHLT